MKHWEGQAHLFDGTVARPREVRLIIAPQGLRLAWEGREEEWEPPAFRVGDEESDGFFRIEKLETPGTILEVRSQSALDALRANGFARSPLFAGMHVGNRIALLLALFLGLVAFLWFVGIDWGVSAALRAIPEGADRIVGETAFDQFVSGKNLADDSLTAAALSKCAHALGETGAAGDSLRIVLVDEPILNAFALHGGYIVLFRGILDDMQSQEELLGLLAHEAGHVRLRHGMRRLVRSVIIGVGATLLFGDASGISSVVLDNSATLLSLDYSRKEEEEADAYAVERLMRRGFDHEGMAVLFERIQKSGDMPRWLTFASTHPATDDRIRFIRSHARSDVSAVAVLSPGEWDHLRGVTETDRQRNKQQHRQREARKQAKRPVESGK